LVDVGCMKERVGLWHCWQRSMEKGYGIVDGKLYGIVDGKLYVFGEVICVGWRGEIRVLWVCVGR